MSTLISLFFGQVWGALVSASLSLLHDYHERLLQKSIDQVEASTKKLENIKRAITATRGVDADIAANGVYQRDADSID